MAATFTYEGVTYPLVDERLTFAEACAIEKVTGIAFGEIEGDPKVRKRASVVLAMVWVSAKRVNPTLTWAQVGSWAMTAVEWNEDEPDPTTPEETPAPNA